MGFSRRCALLGLAALAVPLQAAAGSGVGGQLVLTPASGPQGSHFTATFTFSGMVCNRFSVDFWWDNTHALGSGHDPSSGQSCQVSVDAVVPGEDADPGTSHTVAATSRALPGVAVDDGPGPTASATYQVEPQSSGAIQFGSHPSSSTSSSSHRSGGTTSAASTDQATSSSSSDTSSDTATATATSTSSDASSSAPPALAATPPRLQAPPGAGGGGGLVGLIAGLAAALAVFAGGGLAQRAGILRLPRRA